MAKIEVSKGERFVSVWGPVITVILTAAAGLITWSCNTAAERAHQDYLRREKRYAGLVSSISGFYVDGTEVDKSQFLAELDLCWLYCSDEVIHTAYFFLDSVKTGAQSTKADKQQALGRLVHSIRSDLLNRKPIDTTKLTPEDFKILKPSIPRGSPATQ